MYCVPGSSSSAVGTQPARSSAMNGVITLMARLMVGCDTPKVIQAIL
jgi:hypothetical protein